MLFSFTKRSFSNKLFKQTVLEGATLSHVKQTETALLPMYIALMYTDHTLNNSKKLTNDFRALDRVERSIVRTVIRRTSHRAARDHE